MTTKIDPLQLNDYFAGTPYTIGYILEVLEKNCPEFLEISNGTKVKSLTQKDIENKGCMSHVFRTFIHFDNDTTFSFILKIPRTDLDQFFKDSGRSESYQISMSQDLKDIHIKECDAYDLVKNFEDFPLPKIFHLEYADKERPGAIFMEDLTEKAKTLSFFESARQRQCLNVARHLGEFQAQLNKCEEKWIGKYPKSYHTNPSHVQFFYEALERLVLLNGDLKNPVDKLLKVDLQKFSEYVFKELPGEFDSLTMCHGDAGANNVLIKLNEDGSISDEISAFIDWQVLHEGNPYHDLARFLLISADADIRRLCEEKAVNLQYETFCKKSKELGIEVKFSREQAQKLYDFAVCHQTLEEAQITIFFHDRNFGNVPDKVWEVQKRKELVNIEFALIDCVEKMEKYGVFGRFVKIE